MSDLRRVSSNPHVRSKTTTSNIMMWVVIALLPTTGFGIYNFGLNALIIILLTMKIIIFVLIIKVVQMNILFY